MFEMSGEEKKALQNILTNSIVSLSHSKDVVASMTTNIEADTVVNCLLIISESLMKGAVTIRERQRREEEKEEKEKVSLRLVKED